MRMRDDRAIFGLCVGLALVFVVVSGGSVGTVGFVAVLLALLLIVLTMGTLWP
jgi:O-antigen ligase